MSARRFFRKLAGRKITGLYELSTPEIHRTVLEAIENSGWQLSGNCLDIGSGGGQWLRLMAARYSLNPLRLRLHQWIDGDTRSESRTG